ncbi:dTDP-L-rhamnose 4-epimerase [Tamaricihabitans halophyticus]|uniref:dTDP-L-rhamnose 4-epimerase n=1 Tax=Tamaricihabitans halophyticus TaxID=1262583 RepID=A0A4R2QVD9_9PSEU|nr:NAD-dependent epimerase/dehydratase family protein [Tamaricihabitans halophyticus]TCP53039.1 dTDP-L-rhamnose 4-epimerase [Tamaricihabitans halophyticus]
MRVLVTGGAGFIGSHIVDQLVAEGHEAIVLDSLHPAAHRSSAVPDYLATHEVVRARLTDASALRELLAGVDVVCHQAAMVGHGVSPADTPDYTLANDHGTGVLLAEMYRAGVHRLVLASSMVVYGDGRYRCAEHGIVTPAHRRQSDIAEGRFDPPCPHCGAQLGWLLVPEDAPVDPRSTYAASKLAQEHLAAAWARQTGGSCWALRYHNVYGPRMPRDTPYAGVAALFRSALESGAAPTVLEDGAQRRDFVHVHDVARANLAALNALDAPEDTAGALTAVNICSGQSHTVGEFAAALAKAIGGPEPRIVGGARPADVRHIVADPARADKLLGFTARIAFQDAVAQFATAPLRE